MIKLFIVDQMLTIVSVSILKNYLCIALTLLQKGISKQNATH
jgi:uncharacterized protein YaaN involved in tellurite resistance